MTRQTVKNRVNAILSETTKGLHRDDYWTPVHEAFRKLAAAGYDVTLTGTRYNNDENGAPCAKTWTFEVACGKKPLFGIMTAHGAGTVQEPLSAYDVSAYVS